MKQDAINNNMWQLSQIVHLLHNYRSKLPLNTLITSASTFYDSIAILLIIISVPLNLLIILKILDIII